MKMLRSTKHFGRCPYCGGNHKGHGNCVVTREIQSVAIERAMDKLQAQREIDAQLQDYISEEAENYAWKRYHHYCETGELLPRYKAIGYIGELLERE